MVNRDRVQGTFIADTNEGGKKLAAVFDGRKVIFDLTEACKGGPLPEAPLDTDECDAPAFVGPTKRPEPLL